MPLTDLENTVLGNVWKKGECSGYEVLREFKHSTAAYYKSREGAIYPLLSRLERHGFIRGRNDRRGLQARRLYKITAKGLRALRTWLRGPIPDADATVPPDLIRTRIYFLGAVTLGERRAMLRSAAMQVEHELAANRAKLKQSRDEGNLFGELALEGIMLAMRARLKWLHKIAGAVRDKPSLRTPRRKSENPRRPQRRRR